ncbi:hypothetical protein ACXHQJ_22515 [Vibrio vulnificus]|nr:hypothetical protein [Vibrio parahaemolyticus]HCG8849612.1 hypothetical protein [Vibrio parahaemolyticus]HDY7887785.1 hypothetical protein [Vibrio vulnificus]
MKYILLIIGVLLASPALVKIYTEYVPGTMIGSVDGWLSFLGGYSGGLLAFFAAYQIFNRQRQDNIRPLLVLEQVPSVDKLGDLYFTDDAGKELEEKGNDIYVAVCLKNIGLASALNISIKHIETKRKLKFYSTKIGDFVDLPYLGHVEKSGAIYWSIRTPRALFESDVVKTLGILVEFSDLYGAKHTQEILVTFNNDKQHYFTEIRT